MTTKTRHAGKRRKKISVANLVLALVLGALIFLVYKNMNAVSKNIDGQSDGAVENGYSVIDMDSADLARGDLVLVNKSHPYPFPESLKLVSIYDHKKSCYFVRDKNVLLDKSIMENLNDMMEGFAKETGIRDVNVVAGHRTYEFQEHLYDDSLETKGPEHTTQYIALPGCSEHHTGLAVDFSIFHSATGDSEEFDASGSYGWLEENSWAYGFVRRFTQEKSSITDVADEPWHFRYVGIPHAYYMKENNLCLEEYIDLLRQYPYDGEHLIIDTGEHKYEVYFCSGTKVHVPDKGSYKISGNNTDGFIVTAETGET